MAPIALLVAVALASCSGNNGESQGKQSQDQSQGKGSASGLDRRRVLASVHYINSRLEEPRHRDEVLRAVDESRECARLAPDSPTDELNLAICLLRQYDEKKFTSTETAPAGAALEDWTAKAKPLLDEATRLLDDVRAKRPDLAAAHFHAAMAAARRGKLEAADPASDWQQKLTDAGAAYLKLEDRSSAIRYHLGTLQSKAEKYVDAEQSLRRAVALDPDHPNAYYALGQAIARQNDPNKRGEIARIFETHRNLQESIGKQRAQWDPDAVYDPAYPELVAASASGSIAPVEGAARFEAIEAPAAISLALPILRGDPAEVPGSLAKPADEAVVARAALVAFPNNGAPAFWRFEGAKLANANEKAPDALDAQCGAVGDLDGDHYIDAIVGTDKGVVWLRARGPRPADGYERKNIEGLPTDLGAIADLAVADFDTDGDLDLLVIERAAAGSRVRFYRNDSEPSAAPAETPAENLTFVPRYTELADGAGIVAGAGEAPVRILLADFDDHNDTDVCIVGKSKSLVFMNRRGFQFAKTSELPGALDGAVGDVDGDGLPDVVLADVSGITLCAAGPGGFRPRPLEASPTPNPRIALVDLENRGSLDIVAFSDNLVSVLRHQGAARSSTWRPASSPAASAGLRPRSRRPTSTGTTTSTSSSDAKENRRSPTEMWDRRTRARSPSPSAARRPIAPASARRWRQRAGGLRVRREAWTLPLLVAVGPRPRVDGLFLKWTNGIDEAQGDVATGRYSYALEKRGREGSCPFVYSWDGSKFTFVTDALGATPLGLYAAPNLWVPPQDREWMRIRSDQLAPKDGMFEIRFTEEMREVTYLDRVRLLCVDHPAGTSIYPDERFCFPPFPDKRILRVAKERPVRSARNSDGRDVTELLLSEDRRFVRPRADRIPRNEQRALPRARSRRPRGSKTIRLFLTGWFAWTNSSINRAIALLGFVSRRRAST